MNNDVYQHKTPWKWCICNNIESSEDTDSDLGKVSQIWKKKKQNNLRIYSLPFQSFIGWKHILRNSAFINRTSDKVCKPRVRTRSILFWISWILTSRVCGPCTLWRVAGDVKLLRFVLAWSETRSCPAGKMGMLPYVTGYRAGYKAAKAADGPGGTGYDAAYRTGMQVSDLIILAPSKDWYSS